MRRPEAEPPAKGGLRLPRFEISVLLLCGAAAFLLVPLRDPTLERPLLAFAATLMLFLAPGTLLARWSLRERFGGVSLLAVGFVLSVGLFAVLGVPLLILQRSIDAYLTLCGITVGGSLALAALGAVVGREAREAPGLDLPSLVLWPPFLALTGAVAYLSGLRRPGIYDDTWVYVAWVREFAWSERLATVDPYFGEAVEATSRARINGWLLEQAALVRVSGIDPLDLSMQYLRPTLVVFSFLLVYALARVLFRSAPAALLAGCLFALFSLASLGYTPYNFGEEIVARIVEDKFASRYLFLPAALAVSVAYVEGGDRRYLAIFTLLCWASVAVHPAGYAIIGLSMLGFGLFQVAAKPRDRAGWARMISLAAGVLSVVLLPGAYLAATGRSPAAFLSSADINAGDPEVLRNMAFVRIGWKHVYEFGGGLYTMHPDYLMNGFLIAAFLVGVPFLLFRLHRSLSARLLLGALLLPTLVCFVPPVSTFVGNNVVVPGQLWRLAWPIPLAALLTVGWMAWEIARRSDRRPDEGAPPSAAIPVLCALSVGALTLGLLPTIFLGIAGTMDSGSTTEDERYPYDPALRWVAANVDGPAVLLASDMENTWIPAYTREADVVSLRGYAVLNNREALEARVGEPIEVPPRYRDVRTFFRHGTTEERLDILRRYDVDYLMLHERSRVDGKIRGLSGFRRLETPGDRYEIYRVDREALGT